MSTQATDKIQEVFAKQNAILFFDCKQSICTPIDWGAIMLPSFPPNTQWTPTSVRAYLSLVVSRMNNHFAMIMSGRHIGWLELTRLNRNPTKPPVKVVLSTWKCRQLFPKKLNITWLESGKRKRFHMAVFALWMKSCERKEVQLETAATLQLGDVPNIGIKWLKKMLSLSETDACPIVFNALNIRKLVYESFWNVVGQARKHEWSAKRISECLYRLFPASRPKNGKRPRLKGVYVIDIPCVADCYDVLNEFKSRRRLRM